MGVKVREKVKGSGVYWVFVNHQGGRKAKQVGDKKAANAVASEIRKRIGEQEFKIAPRGRLFEVVATEWLDQVTALRGIRTNTHENYRSAVVHHLKPAFGREAIGRITTGHVERFIAAKLRAGGSARHADKALSRASLRPLLVTLRMILQKAVKAGELDTNPMNDLDRMPRGETDSVDPFTTDELRAILTAAQDIDPVAPTFVRLWTQTGMRAGEMAALQWGDFDLERGTVQVQRTYSRKRIGPPKRGGARTVSLLHPVAEAVAEWKPGSTVEARAVIAGIRRLPVVGADPTRYLFGRDGEPLRVMDLHRLWRRIIVKARVRYRPPEQLRHTFASTMLSRNAPLLYVQKQGGWSSATVMLKVYARWLPGPELTAQPTATLLQPGREQVL